MFKPDADMSHNWRIISPSFQVIQHDAGVRANALKANGPLKIRHVIERTTPINYRWWFRFRSKRTTPRDITIRQLVQHLLLLLLLLMLLRLGLEALLEKLGQPAFHLHLLEGVEQLLTTAAQSTGGFGGCRCGFKVE